MKSYIFPKISYLDQSILLVIHSNYDSSDSSHYFGFNLADGHEVGRNLLIERNVPPCAIYAYVNQATD